MNGPAQPVCWIIAGPNGAGKTTFALKYLPEVGCRSFVNADLIAAGMAPLAPESQRIAASRLFLSEIERNVAARRDFGFETTLAGRGYLRLIRRLKAAGWRNLFGVYASLVDHTVCFLNRGDVPEIVFTQEAERREVKQPTVMHMLAHWSEI